MPSPRNPYSATRFCLLLGVALLAPVALYLLWVLGWWITFTIDDLMHPRPEPRTIWEAARDGNFEVLNRELEKGADPNAPDPQWGEVPLNWAAMDSDEDRAEIIKRLLRAGADPNYGAPLVQAAASCNTAVTKELLTGGADTSQTVVGGWTALHYASMNDCVDVMQLLIAAGADLNVRSDQGLTPLIWAAETAKVDAVRVLLEAGADRSITDNKGRTAYDAASITTGELAYWYRKVRKLLRE